MTETIAKIDYGGVALLENVRFHAGETGNDPDFARRLAEPADIFVNDAFGAAHRSHASVVGLARLLPAYPGFLLESEIIAIGTVLNNPDRPLAALVGGAKISSKIGVLRNLVEKVDMLLLGGGMANTFLAANGLNMRASLVESGRLQDARDIQNKALASGCEIVLPRDGVMASGPADGAETAVCAVEHVPDGWMMLDIGPETERLFAGRLGLAATVVWNGPMGMFENRGICARHRASRQGGRRVGRVQRGWRWGFRGRGEAARHRVGVRPHLDWRRRFAGDAGRQDPARHRRFGLKQPIHDCTC